MILGLLIIIGIIFVGGIVLGIANIVSGGKLLELFGITEQLMKMATSNLQEILVCSIVRVELVQMSLFIIVVEVFATLNYSSSSIRSSE